ncbi:MAG: hypothetical protein RLZZ426_753 [Actinomycetota bacterium]|jgi:hypothetical protein
MNVLEIIATADPLRRRIPINIEFVDLKIPFDESQNFAALRRRRQRVLIQTLVAACMAMFVLLSFVTPTVPTATSIYFSTAQQSAAKFALRQSQLVQSVPRVLPNQVLKRGYQNVVSHNGLFSPLPTSGVLTSSTSQRFDVSSTDFSPGWESTVDFSSIGAMRTSLNKQSLSHILSVQSQQEWINKAIDALIVSETAPPAQRFVALAVSQSATRFALDPAPWRLNAVNGKMAWVREVPSGFSLIRDVVDPNTPGIWVTARYRLSAFSDPVLYSYSLLTSWAVVSDVSGETLATSNAGFELFDLSKL